MKDAYYFSHDSNAKDDPKCVLLIEQLGMEGYGIFWVLIESLRDQPEYKYPLALIPALARRYNTTTEKVKTVVLQYGFFEIENDEFFYSDSLNRRMKGLSKFRESQRQKALKRWSDAPALPRDCHGNADLMPVKESKVKESKEKESIDTITPDEPAHRSQSFKPPTIDDVRDYCKERKNHVDPDRFVDFYAAKGWMVGKNKMKDWKAAVRTWDRGDEAGRATDNQSNNGAPAGGNPPEVPKYGKIF